LDTVVASTSKVEVVWRTLVCAFPPNPDQTTMSGELDKGTPLDFTLDHIS